MSKKSTLTMNSGKPKTILIVDDSHQWTLVLARLLSNKGHEVITANSGEEALDVYANISPDLILTDLRMQGISGLELAETIRTQDYVTPIIVLSAYSSVVAAISALKVGVNDFLVKTTDIDQIVACIDKLLGMNSEEIENAWLKGLISTLKEENRRLNESLKEQESKISVNANADENDTFYSLIAHDVAGEILTIGGSLKIIRDLSSDSPEIQEECDSIKRSLHYLRQLVLRMQKRVDIDRPTIEHVAVTELMTKAESLIRPRIPSNIRFDVTADQNAHEGRVLVDTEQLIGVLLEIVNNAIHALRSSKGIIELGFSVRDGYLLITMSNNGPMIPEEIREKLFQGRVRSSKEKGTGMGLFLAGKVLKGLGGTISLQQSSPELTTFMVQLPLYELQKGA